MKIKPRNINTSHYKRFGWFSLNFKIKNETIGKGCVNGSRPFHWNRTHWTKGTEENEYPHWKWARVIKSSKMFVGEIWIGVWRQGTVTIEMICIATSSNYSFNIIIFMTGNGADKKRTTVKIQKYGFLLNLCTFWQVSKQIFCATNLRIVTKYKNVWTCLCFDEVVVFERHKSRCNDRVQVNRHQAFSNKFLVYFLLVFLECQQNKPIKKN